MWKSCGKRIRGSLTLRIFLITTLILLSACGVTYGFIVWATPISYSAVASDELSNRAIELCKELRLVNVEDSSELLTRFASATGADLSIVDEHGESVVSFSMEGTGGLLGWGSGSKASDQRDTAMEPVTENVETAAGTASTESDVSAVSQDSAVPGASIFSFYESDVVTSIVVSDGSLSFPVSFADKKNCTLSVLPSVTAVNQTVEAMGRVLPYLAVVVVLLSLAGAHFYSRFITRPIVRLSGISQKMADLDFSWTCPEVRQDEIGILGQNLNQLSCRLSTALTDLQTANAALQADIDRQRELERQRSAFFDAASHELKTPITVLKGQLSGMLAGVDVYKDRDRYLERSLAVTGRMETLVREMLTISRMERGGGAELRAVDLSALVQAQAAQAEDLAVHRGQSLMVELVPEVSVTGDQALLGRVVSNLLTNALTYSPPGNTVAVCLSGGETGAVLTVENSGTHIPEEALPHLFEAFYRVEASRNRDTGGSGLGLYLTQMILSRHGAVCTVENTQAGVKATVYFPAKRLSP